MTGISNLYFIFLSLKMDFALANNECSDENRDITLFAIAFKTRSGVPQNSRLSKAYIHDMDTLKKSSAHV